MRRSTPQTAPADQLRDAADELLLQDAYNLRKPVFGICYGLQSLNVWRTGTLVQHIESKVNHDAGSKVEVAHNVTVAADSLLAREILNGASGDAVPVNSSHHQSAEVVGDGLRAVARCPEDGVIEAIEGTAPGTTFWRCNGTRSAHLSRIRLPVICFAGFVESARQWMDQHA